MSLMASVTADAKNELAEWCERQWDVATSDPGEGLEPSYGALAARWQQYATKCSGTVVYEARLAFLYALMDRPAKARAILKDISSAKSDYPHLVEIASLQTEMAEIFAGSNKGDKKSQLKDLEPKYVAFVGHYPDWAQGYFLLGGIQTTLEHYREAIGTLIAGLNRLPKDKRSAPNLWSIYRHLTVSYSGVGEYRAALGAADVAYELKKGISSDPYFVYAVARANAGLGNFQAAQNALSLIVLKRPEVKDDPKFLDAQDFVNRRMRANAAKQ